MAFPGRMRQFQTMPNNGEPRATYLTGCPVYLIYKSPAVTEALQAHRWWETGQLGQLYQQGIPAALTAAVDAVTNGFARADRDRYEEYERKRKRESGPKI